MPTGEKTAAEWASSLRDASSGALHPKRVAEALVELGHPDHMTLAVINYVYGHGDLDVYRLPDDVRVAHREYLSLCMILNKRVSYARLRYADEIEEDTSRKRCRKKSRSRPRRRRRGRNNKR